MSTEQLPLSPAPPPARRVTLGLLMSDREDALSHAIWVGVHQVASERAVNLIRFAGGSLHDPRDHRRQANVLYDLVSAENVDGLIVWGGIIGTFVALAEIVALCNRYRPLPVVNVALPLPGIPSVLVDSYQGMRALMLHLVRAHRYRRIAFVRGTAAHPEAQERYRAYCDVLAEHQIPLDPQLVVAGNFQSETGVEAVRCLLDERQCQFEALVAANDTMALAAMEVLQARGVRVPEDIAVAGFDNLENGRFATPALTTVSFQPYQQGRLAAECLLAQLAGAAVPDLSVIPAELVIRQSCGCQDAAVVRAAQPAASLAGPHLLHGLAPAMARALPSLPPAQAQAWAEHMWAAWQRALESGAPAAFLHALEHLLRETRAAAGNLADWQDAISVLRQAALAQVPAAAGLWQMESLWHQARVLIGRAVERAQGYQSLLAAQQAQAQRAISQTLITTFDVPELTKLLEHNLPQLGIQSCYLALYEDPDQPTEWARLVLAYDARGRAPLPPGGLRFPAYQLTPKGQLAAQRRYSLVVEALYFREDQLGFVLFEESLHPGDPMHTLRGQLSSALKGALLFKQSADLYQEAVHARAIAEKADQLKTRLLANVSHELRTPLSSILGYTTLALQGQAAGAGWPEALQTDLRRIQDNAQHLMRLINDLLDISRAEIDELDLYPEVIDTHPFLTEVFGSLAGSATAGSAVAWQLQLPERLPVIQADPMRLRQVLLNLLSNAQKFTERGQIVLGAEVLPPHLHLWVGDTGAGIAAEWQERIFESFVTGVSAGRRSDGIGLGLAITRRLVALHRGTITLESQLGRGSTFHIYLPLPSLHDAARADLPGQAQPELWVISARALLAPEIQELGQRQALALVRLEKPEDLERRLAAGRPTAVAWDLAHASGDDWLIVQRLRQHPQICVAPMILYGQPGQAEAAAPGGVAGFLIKPVLGKTLLEVINAVCPPGGGGPVLIVDDDAHLREFYRLTVAEGLPGQALELAEDGLAAVQLMARQTPSVVILDLTMPGMDGFEVLDWMRANPPTRQVPVLILSGRMLTLDDIKRLEAYALVTFQSKGVLTGDETAAAVTRLLSGPGGLPTYTSIIVKRVVAYFHQNYSRQLTRREIAELANVSEDYLSRVFRKEMGLSPLDYLNRYRIQRAKALLQETSASITEVMLQVGFEDSAYFSRVFSRLSDGLSPTRWRRAMKGQ